MSYVLGVDLGTTFTAAAIADAGDVVRPMQFDGSNTSLPSVVFRDQGGEMMVGADAVAGARREPGRAAVEFKRRFGDPTPLVLGSTPYGAEALTGRLLKAVIDQARVDQGVDPTIVVLTHPANWGPYKIELLGESARTAGVVAPRFVPEPVAAASHLAESSSADGGTIAVYDFGGGTFDAAVVRSEPDGFVLVGVPDGMERFGGIDIDLALMHHALAHLPEPPDEDQLLELKASAIVAKETLSIETSATMTVGGSEVRVVRDEFEEMIRPRLDETVDLMRRVVGSAGVGYDELSRVMLVGGSGRIPLVGDMLRAETGRPITLDAEPKLAVARGAAVIGSRALAQVNPDMTMPWSAVRDVVEEIRREGA